VEIKEGLAGALVFPKNNLFEVKAFLPLKIRK